MTREEARKMTLEQFLYYMGDDENFQVCFEGDDWDDCMEFTKDSKFLIPFKECRVACMGAEFDSVDHPTIRISIDDKGMRYGYEDT